MDPSSLIPILITIAVGLTGLGVFVMIAFGLKSLIDGRVSVLSSALIGAPMLIGIGIGFSTGDWVFAAVTTLIILVVATILVILSGVVRSTLGL